MSAIFTNAGNQFLKNGFRPVAEYPFTARLSAARLAAVT
jgi:hypothetical protein